MTHVRMITFSLCDSSRKLNLGWVVWNLNVLSWRQCWQPTLFPALFLWRWLFHQDLFSTGGTACNEITRLAFPAVLWFSWGGEKNLFGKTAITWGVGDGKFWTHGWIVPRISFLKKWKKKWHWHYTEYLPGYAAMWHLQAILGTFFLL